MKTRIKSISVSCALVVNHMSSSCSLLLQRSRVCKACSTFFRFRSVPASSRDVFFEGEIGGSKSSNTYNCNKNNSLNIFNKASQVLNQCSVKSVYNDELRDPGILAIVCHRCSYQCSYNGNCKWDPINGRMVATVAIKRRSIAQL